MVSNRLISLSPASGVFFTLGQKQERTGDESLTGESRLAPISG
jgi:hypothetical protein